MPPSDIHRYQAHMECADTHEGKIPVTQNKINFMRRVDVDEPKQHTINKTGKASLEPQLKPQGIGNSQLFTNQRI